MPIPVKLSKEEYDGLPDLVKQGYKQQSDGSYALDEIPGLVSKAKVDEFRENNRNLQTQLDELTSKMEVFKDIDPEHFKELQEQERRLKEKELIDAGDIDQIVEARVKPIIEAKDNAYKELEEKYTTANSQLSVLMIDDATSALATELGVEPTALMDVKGRARQTFKIRDGKVVAVDPSGEVAYGPDGITPLALDKTWMEGLKKGAPHLFRPAQGTGAKDNSGTRGGSDVDASKLSSVQKISTALNEQDGQQ